MSNAAFVACSYLQTVGSSVVYAWLTVPKCLVLTVPMKTTRASYYCDSYRCPRAHSTYCNPHLRQTVPMIPLPRRYTRSPQMSCSIIVVAIWARRWRRLVAPSSGSNQRRHRRLDLTAVSISRRVASLKPMTDTQQSRATLSPLNSVAQQSCQSDIASCPTFDESKLLA